MKTMTAIITRTFLSFKIVRGKRTGPIYCFPGDRRAFTALALGWGVQGQVQAERVRALAATCRSKRC